MFRLDVFQNQWLGLAMAGGLVIVLCLALYSLAMWQQRSAPTSEGAEKQPGGKRRLWLPPGLLVLTYVFVVVWAVVYTLMMIWNPPNW